MATSKTPGRMVFDHVWKKFHRGNVHDSLRDLIPATVRRIIGQAPKEASLKAGDFWAVKDISFEVNPGQCLGIIGPNGSGKSTTLKLLTRIYAPSLGRCAIFGRVGTLIEVSAGFHGDLSGRENVFLQGAIMGMKIRDIRQKFDEIVDFSGVGDFIDTPVKRYSSGMNARLGFSIAAHLEPDVLVIDEVLAVGDLSFQQKAFGRIKEMTRSGIPVIMVSHQLDRVAELCSHVLVLQRGEMVASGDAADAIASYVQKQGVEALGTQTGPVRFGHVRLLSDETVTSGQTFGVHVEGHLIAMPDAVTDPLKIRVRSLRTGMTLFISGASALGVKFEALGPFSADIRLQANLPTGAYLVEVASQELLTGKDLASAPPLLFRVDDRASFNGTVQLNPLVTVRGS